MIVRITRKSVPYLFASFHPGARQYSKLRTNLCNALTEWESNSMFICNYYDFISGCLHTNIYETYQPKFETIDFIHSKYFIDAILSGGDYSQYYESFRKTVSLFLKDIVLASRYLSFITKQEIVIIPTFPQALIKALSSHQLMNFVEFDTTLPELADSVKETVIGWFIHTYRSAGTFDFVTQLRDSHTSSYIQYCTYLLADLFADSRKSDSEFGQKDRVYLFTQGVTN